MTALAQPSQPVRTAVIGIGHELRGDDAAGVMAARALKRLASAAPHLLVIEAGTAPENHTGVLRRFAPDLVLLVDAADMQALPGSVCWLSPESAAGMSASTHTLPLAMFAHYLRAEFGCEVALIGIQPAQLALGSALSPVVKQAVDSLVDGLRQSFPAAPV